MGFPIPSNVIEIDFFMYLIDHKVNIRPEDFSLQKDSEFTDDTYLKTTIEVIEPLGNETFLYFNVNGMQYVARVDSDTKSKVGDLITLYLNPNKIYFFNNKGERFI